MYRILIVSCWFGTALATRRLPDFCYDLEGLTLPDDYNPMVSPPLPSSLKEQFFNRSGHIWKAVLELDKTKVIDSHNLIPEVTGIDDHKQEIKLPIFSTKSWFDPRLSLSTNGTKVRVPYEFFSKCLYSPNFIYLFLAKAEVWRHVTEPFEFVVDTFMDTVIVRQTSYLIITLSCIMEFSWYPFDWQNCYVLESNLDIDMNEKGMNNAIFSGLFLYDKNMQRKLQYEITMSPLSPGLLQGPVFGLPLVLFGWNIKLKRKLSSHLMATFGPTAVFVSVTWISFLIPPEVVPGRMALLVTMLLVMVSVFLKVISETPPTDSITMVGVWMIMCILAVIAALLVYGFILYLEQRLKRDQLKLDKVANHQRHTKEVIELRSKVKRIKWLIGQVDYYSLVTFPLGSIVAAGIYWYHCMAILESPPDDDLVLRSLAATNITDLLVTLDEYE